MFTTDTTHGKTVKEIRAAEKAKKEAVLLQECEQLVTDKFGADKLAQWQKEYGDLFYLPVLDETETNIEAIAIMKPITRHILSYASTKMADGGLYDFLEAAMRECFIDGDNKILEDDEYFIPAANSFNKIIDQKKSNFLKR
ncbi:hypothetical protein [Arachidicoccus soli]|uniref:Uncharacterized protein n=1 Tax=Arachidicoccus soli TaxID=2341117 RepID=A0A386HRA2_9BACT|nr:hypothetical protein [Arachidicoccus soli]AYD48202.1 hypothetical protein D6B99_11700 [Arachidicoccus soli]